MQSRRITHISLSSVIAAVILGFSASPALATSFKCVDNGTVEVCVEWSNNPKPVEGTNFFVTYHGSAGADVELATGDLEWRLWTTLVSDGSVTDFGDITLNPTVPSDNFEVSIKNGTGAGAVNVGSIVLDDAGFTGYSNLGETLITGNVDGAITLIEFDDGMNPPVGGEVTGVVTITGSVVGPVTIPKVTGNVYIFGHVLNLIDIEEISGGLQVNVSADITVGTLSGTLHVTSTVPFGKTVTIQNLAETGIVTLQTLGGRLDLLNGIPSSCPSNVQDCESGSDFAVVTVPVLSGTGVIDLKGADMAGVLSLAQAQNNSQIIAVGAVSGFLYPGFTITGYFNGTLDVSSVSNIPTVPGIDTGEIEVFLGAALNGIINVSGSVAGLVETSGPFTGQINVGSVASTGVIEAFQGALGTIVVDGALLGTIEVVGDLGGSIKTTSGGALGATGKIEVTGALTGSAKILVSGMCDGEVQIGQQTDPSTLIHLLGGLESTGKIKINTTEGNFNADGDIHVGPIFYIALPPGQPPPITFDGCIRIHDEAVTGNGGDLSSGAEIKVVGCHEDGGIDDALNICIDGSINGDITIVQTNCPHQVVHSCSTCP